MSKVLADYYPRNISQYTPLMEFAADVVDGKHLVNLGAPSTADPNGIMNQFACGATAATFTSANWATTFDGSSTHVGESVAGTLNGKFGRCLQLVSSAGADHTITVTGRDYLGQIMSEVFTLVNTVPQYGNKAFKYVDTVAVDAGGQAGDTTDIGWTDRMGLPYKAEKIIAYTEDDVSFPVDSVQVTVEVDAVRFAAGTDVVVPSPVAGQITAVRSVVTTATTGASTATVVVGSTDVLGLSIVIATGAGVAVQDSDTATTDNDQATSRVDKFEAIGISPDATPSAGAANYMITVEPLTFVAGDETTATTSTTDTRGTILVTTPCDASIEYEVYYTCDTANLHGLAQA